MGHHPANLLLPHLREKVGFYRPLPNLEEGDKGVGGVHIRLSRIVPDDLCRLPNVLRRFRNPCP